MEANDVLSLIVLLCLLWLPLNWWRQRRNVRQTAGWPLTEATIETVQDEVVSHSKRPAITLPVLAFSYHVAGEYYSGRFALYPYIADPGDMTRMIGRKLQVRYNPDRPETWFIPDKLIEGCKVEQKMCPNPLGLNPHD